MVYKNKNYSLVVNIFLCFCNPFRTSLRKKPENLCCSNLLFGNFLSVTQFKGPHKLLMRVLARLLKAMNNSLPPDFPALDVVLEKPIESTLGNPSR